MQVPQRRKSGLCDREKVADEYIKCRAAKNSEQAEISNLCGTSMCANMLIKLVIPLLVSPNFKSM